MLRLVANELGFLDRQVVCRAQKICWHLAEIENRSFILLGNVPLTFGSMTSVS